MFSAASKTWSQPRSQSYNQSDELPIFDTGPEKYAHSPYSNNSAHASIPADCYLVSRTVAGRYPSPPEQGARSAPANCRTPRYCRQRTRSNRWDGTTAGKRLPSVRGRAGNTHRQSSRCRHVGTTLLSPGFYPSAASRRPCTIGGREAGFAPPRGRFRISSSGVKGEYRSGYFRPLVLRMFFESPYEGFDKGADFLPLCRFEPKVQIGD